jgi:transposase
MFLNFLKYISNFQNVICLWIRCNTSHYKSKKVLKYVEENNDTIIPVYLPTASPEFMVMEEVWNIAKRDLFILKYYSSFEDFKRKISAYLRTKRFNLNMSNYLLRDIF